MTDATEGKKRDLPLWVGILLIAIGLAGAGWFIWSQVSGFWTGPSGVFTIEGVDPSAPRPQQQQRRQPNQAPPPPQLTVREAGANSWRVRSAGFSLSVDKAADGKLETSMNISSSRVLPEDYQWVLVSKTRLTDEVAKQLGLSAEQANQFKALPTNVRHELPLEDAHKQQLASAFQKYLDAGDQQRPQAERELANAMQQTGRAATPILATRLRQRYERFKSSITPEQWSKLQQLAVSQPASEPAGQ